MTQIHPSGIDPNVVAKVVARRGRLHAFESLDPHHTALIVIDLTVASVERDGGCRTVIAPINAVAAALRAVGGTVAWVTPRGGPGVEDNLAAILGIERARTFATESAPDSPGAATWPELDVVAGDLAVTKLGASAVFPGRCDLHHQLQVRGVDTVLIAGTVTNVCCESSARDVTELGLSRDHDLRRLRRSWPRSARGIADDLLPNLRRCPPRRRGHRPLPSG